MVCVHKNVPRESINWVVSEPKWANMAFWHPKKILHQSHKIPGLHPSPAYTWVCVNYSLKITLLITFEIMIHDKKFASRSACT